MKLHPASILNSFKLIGYVLLLGIDEAITVLSMLSVGHSVPEKIGLASFGFIIVLLGAWVFLSGIRSHGPERYIKLGAWVLSVFLVVSINWAFTRTMIRTQSSTVSNTQADTEFDKQTREKQINGYLDKIETLTKKLDTVNVWREADRKAISDDIDKANAEIEKLKVKPTVTTIEVNSVNVFEKMSAPVGGNQELISDLWWALLFTVAQIFTVLAAPKSDDKRPRRKHAPRITRDVSMRRLVEWWVSTNWMGIRTGKSRTILSRESFDKFTSERWQPFPSDKYDAILQAANRTQIIDGAEIREADEATAIKRILANVGKQKADQPELF
jgi:hypothetical protein